MKTAHRPPLKIAPRNGRRPGGRGSLSNRSSRFERLAREPFDDGWAGPPDADAQNAKALRTEVTIETPRRILTRNVSPDISFDRSINPYRGCEHGCSYCFARPTHAFLDLSPGLDFESKLFAKPEAAKLLRKELSNPNYQPDVVAMGTNTDPYQPIERQFRITRSVLEVLAACHHPVGIVTKSGLIARDIDILGPMAEKGLVKVAISLTTLDRALARALEPRACAPDKRLETIRALSRAGIPTSVLVAPVIPALNDMEIEDILKTARRAGAHAAGYVLLRLPLEIKTLFEEWLEANVPDRKAHVMTIVRNMHGGKAYDAAWGLRQRGRGPYADLVRARFEKALKRLGMADREIKLRCDLFRPPEAWRLRGRRDTAKSGGEQLSFF